MKTILITLTVATSSWLAAGAASAQDEPLPQEVAQAYLAYEAAVEEQEYAAALAAAETAWREAEAARVDNAITGTLAVNYGALALRMGEFSIAHEALREAARLGDRSRETAVERADRWYLASMAAYANEDIRDARSCARRAVRALRDAEDAPPLLSGNAHYMSARMSAISGRFSNIGENARTAIEAYENAPGAPRHSLADAYYLSGIDHFFWGERSEAAIAFHRSALIWSEIDMTSEAFRSARIWTRMTVRELGAEEGEVVSARIREIGMPESWGPAPASATEDGPTDAYDVDAQPSYRADPEYPINAAYANVGGVVYVGFDVDERGRTENVEVIISAPQGIFDDAALDAVRSWRYEPAILDGEPVVRHGIETRFDFTMCPYPSRRACDTWAREEMADEED